nr:unnamed protein product [Digitaria exilis]
MSAKGAESSSGNGEERELERGDPAGSKRPRIGARTCGELTRGASDREIRGGRRLGRRRRGVPPHEPARGPRELPGLRGSTTPLSRACSRVVAFAGAGARSLSPGFVCVGFGG